MDNEILDYDNFYSVNVGEIYSLFKMNEGKIERIRCYKNLTFLIELEGLRVAIKEPNGYNTDTYCIELGQLTLFDSSLCTLFDLVENLWKLNSNSK